MNIREQIDAYIAALPDAKRTDIEILHRRILALLPGCKLWFLDGRNDQGKIVSNPNIGYGLQTMNYTDGRTKEFYQAGISANTNGISVYIMGLSDKAWLAQTYSEKLGKASVSGYCVKFRSLTDINIDVLEEMIREGVKQTTKNGHGDSNN